MRAFPLKADSTRRAASDDARQSARQHTPLSAELAMHRALGNQTYGQLIQARLTIGQPDDPYEREADRVADEVLGMAEPAGAADAFTPPPDPPVQRMCAEEDQHLQRKPAITPLVQRQTEEHEEEETADLVQPERVAGAATPGLQRQIDEQEDQTLQARNDTGHPLNPPPDFGARLRALRGGGQPLTPAQRGFFDPRFGYDFSGVRLHTGGEAAEAARAIKARAFTTEQDVVFGAGQYAPGTTAGKRLLAHELTHVVQQTAPTVYTAPTIQRRAAEFSPVETPNAEVEAIATPGLIVEDEAVEFAVGQMGKSAFLAVLRTAVCSTTEKVLETVGRSMKDCPYLDSWFEYYASRSSAHIEQAIHRYAPEAAGAAAASDYIPVIVARVRLGVEIWARFGKLTGIPEGVSTEPPAATPATEGDASGPGTGASTVSSEEVRFKAREGGTRNPGSPAAVRAQLGEGHALEGGVRARMESAFGTNFSDVRIHTEATAATLSDRHNARAFTIGSDVAFGAGEYRPGTPVGDALLAHELAHVNQQRDAASAGEQQQKGTTSYDSLEADADRSAVGAVVGLWTGANERLKDIAENAMPRLKSGLRLQRCRKSEGYEKRPYEYHGVGGGLHGYVYEPLREDYTGWMEWSENLTEELGEEVPVVGHLVGGIVGFIPWWAGAVGNVIVGVPQFFTPKTQEEHFIFVMSAGTGVAASHTGSEIKYGWLWVKNFFKKNPKLEKELIETGVQSIDDIAKKAANEAPEKIKTITGKKVASAAEAKAAAAESKAASMAESKAASTAESKAPAKSKTKGAPAKPSAAASRISKKLLDKGYDAETIKALQKAGFDVSKGSKFHKQLMSAGKTTRDFMNTFHSSSGFDKVVKNWAAGDKSQVGARFVMKYCVKKLKGESIIFEWPAGIKSTVSGETWARHVDVVVKGGTKVRPGNTIYIEFKSWTTESLKKTVGRVKDQMTLDTALFDPKNIRWVWDASKTSQDEVLDAFVKIVSQDPYLKAKWGASETDLRKALLSVIEMF